MSKIYIAASWKQRERVNKISKELSSRGHVVFDFTDNASRAEVNRHMCLDFPIYATSPKATYPERYDPTKQKYGHYLREMHEYDDVMKNNLASSRNVMSAFCCSLQVQIHTLTGVLVSERARSRALSVTLRAVRDLRVICGLTRFFKMTLSC